MLRSNAHQESVRSYSSSSIDKYIRILILTLYLCLLFRFEFDEADLNTNNIHINCARCQTLKWPHIFTSNILTLTLHHAGKRYCRFQPTCFIIPQVNSRIPNRHLVRQFSGEAVLFFTVILAPGDPPLFTWAFTVGSWQ